MGFTLGSSLKANLVNNRRRAIRQKRDLNGWIQSKGSIAVQECRILDLSQTGVRLALVDAHKITNGFILYLSKNGTGRNATVKWRRGTQIGAEI
jgi:hypothetical protein